MEILKNPFFFERKGLKCFLTAQFFYIYHLRLSNIFAIIIKTYNEGESAHEYAAQI